MSDLREHATVNDVIENVRAGNVKLQYNETANFVKFTTVEDMPYMTPDLVKIDVPRGAIAVKMPIPTITTRRHDGEEEYKDYWYKVYFADGSYLSYYFDIEWSESQTPLVTYWGGKLKFFLHNDDGTYTESEAGTWGQSIDGGAWNHWFQTIDPVSHLTVWDYTPVIITPNSTFLFYIYLSYDSPYRLGYGFSPIRINTIDLSAEYGTDSRNMPIVNWYFVNGWEDFYDFLAGNAAEGTQYPGEDSETGGGHGTFYNRNDEIGLPTIPSLQAIDLGFTTLYNPHPADVRALAHWLWYGDFSDNIKMNYIDPMNNLLGINFVALPENMIQNERATFVIGNCNSGIQTLKVTTGNKNQYIELDCGDINLPEYWQNFLDYDTQFSIWLPYIGFRSLRADDVLQATEDNGGYLNVTYYIDLLTGCAVCHLICKIEDNRTHEMKEHLLYSFNCNVFYSTPISGANYTNMYNQQLSAVSSGINTVVNSVGQLASGNLFSAVSGIASLLTGGAQAKMQYDTAKPDYGRAGNSGGNVGYFSYKKPYIIRTQSIGQTPKNYSSLQGIPSQIYATLSTLTGYTEIDTVIVDTLNSCTSEEKSEILNILKGGVIL